jgi:uncharacterized protein (DUF736 family)
MSLQKKELGALWERQSKKGMTFFSGIIEINGKKTEIVAFRETNKKNEKQPDWRIYESEPKQMNGTTPQPRMNGVISHPVMTEDDLPF